MKTKLLKRLRARYSRKYSVKPYFEHFFCVRDKEGLRFFTTKDKAEEYIEFLVSEHIERYVRNKRKLQFLKFRL